MKMKIRNIFAGLTAAISLSWSVSAMADNCRIHLMVAPIDQGEYVPEQVADMLNSRLEMALTDGDGVTADTYYDRFFVAAKFNHIYQDVVPGPPAQHAVHSTLTLYIGDNVTQKIYATTSLEVRGVGNSETRALINAISPLNKRNQTIISFLSRGTDKILDYYNKEYPILIRQAETAASQRQYDKALSILSAVPECCSGYSKVESSLLKIYNANRDYYAQQLLAMANAAWGANPTSEGAREAYGYLVLIDPASSAYPASQKLHQEMKNTVKSDHDFETREKYRDEVAIRRSQIEAARAIGVAYGNHQQPVTTHVNWIR